MAIRLSRIRQSATINAPPEKVFDALMDSKVHSEFTGSPAKVSRKVGGEFSVWDGYAFGKNLELKRGKKIVQEWSTTDWPEGYPPSKLEISLAKEGSGTLLTMVHSEVPESQKDEYAEGWQSCYWKPLKAYFNRKK